MKFPVFGHESDITNVIKGHHFQNILKGERVVTETKTISDPREPNGVREVSSYYDYSALFVSTSKPLPSKELIVTEDEVETDVKIVLKDVIVEGIVFLQKGSECNYDVEFISGCIFKEAFIVRGYTFNGYFSIYGATFEDSFALESGLIKEKFSIHSDSLFKSTVTFGCNFNNTLIIRGGEFSSTVSFLSGFFKEIIINGGNFLGTVVYENSRILKFEIIDLDDYPKLVPSFLEIIIRTSIFDELEFKGGNFISVLSITSGYIKKINFVYGTYGKISFRTDGLSKYENKEIKNVGNKNNLYVDELNIFDFSNLSIPEFEVIGSHENFILIEHISFKGNTGVDSKFQFKEVRINRISFQDFQNYSAFSFKRISSQAKKEGFAYNGHKIYENDKNPFIYDLEKNSSKLSIDDSDLGICKFSDCDFSSYKFYLRSSLLTQVTLNTSVFPLLIDRHLFAEKPMTHNQLRHSYRVLTRLNLSQGNLTVAKDYNAHEFNAHLKSINRGKNMQEWLVLFLNNITNYHGQNWGRALLLFFILSLASYTGLYYSLSLLSSNFDSSKILPFIAYYTHFINPLHKYDELALGLQAGQNFPPNYVAQIIDSVSKVINSFLIYQFIQAFRKHGRLMR